MTKAQRLQQARIAAGHTSARAAALALGVPVNSYGNHEAGRRDFDPATYAIAFGVDPEWIETGLSAAERQLVALVRAPAPGIALTIASTAAGWAITVAGRTGTGPTFDAAWAESRS